MLCKFRSIRSQAYNKAGLSTTVTSWAFTVEASPPVAGHVFDGDKSQTSGQNDLDFQTHLDYLSAYWEGFNDPHSTIIDYYISIGTCVLCQDVLQHQAIGIVYGTYIHTVFAKNCFCKNIFFFINGINFLSR